MSEVLTSNILPPFDKVVGKVWILYHELTPPTDVVIGVFTNKKQALSYASRLELSLKETRVEEWEVVGDV